MLMPPPNSDHTTPRDDANFLFYFILFFVCVLCGFVLGCCLSLSLLLLNLFQILDQ